MQVQSSNYFYIIFFLRETHKKPFMQIFFVQDHVF